MNRVDLRARGSRRALLTGAAGAALGTVAGSRVAAQATIPDYWPTAGWRVAEPADHGVDPLGLDAVDARAVGEVPALSALLAARHGYIVFERYYDGQLADEPINVRSVTKSVTGTLAGAALRQGLLSGIEQTVAEAIPSRVPEGADPLVGEITLRQWLTMTSGLQWDAYGDWQRMLAAPDWVAMTLSLPVVGIPGQTYVYNTGGTHVLGVTVADAAGKPLEDYGEEVLFRPLGIRPGDWMRSPQGEVSAGSGLEMTPRDMLKLGYLYLRGGVWEGEQIIDPDYAAAATTWQSAGDSTGGWAGYGYQWWITATEAGYPAYFALGYGGQHIFVVPAIDLVVVAAIARRVEREELRTPRFLIESIAASCVPDPI
ncbi:MAG: serine hydrolase domain-containing protein [Thermomicrobiales bacterium]